MRARRGGPQAPGGALLPASKGETYSRARIQLCVRWLCVVFTSLTLANMLLENAILHAVVDWYDATVYGHYRERFSEESMLTLTEDELIPEEDLWEPDHVWDPSVSKVAPLELLVPAPLTGQMEGARAGEWGAGSGGGAANLQDASMFTDDVENMEGHMFNSGHDLGSGEGHNFTMLESIEGRIERVESGREAEAMLREILGPLRGNYGGYRLVHRLVTPPTTAWLPKPLQTSQSELGNLEGCCKTLLAALRDQRVDFNNLTPHHLHQPTTVAPFNSHLLVVANALCVGENCSDYQTNWEYSWRCQMARRRRSVSTKEARQYTSSTVHVPWLLPLYGPWSGSFQHFIRDYAPKLALVPPGVLRDKRLHLLMEKTENPIVLGVLDALGITKERRLFHTDRSAFSSDRLYIPAVHIYDTQYGLYHRFRRLIGVPYKPPLERKTIVYFSRSQGGKATATRKVSNEEEVLEGITAWLKERGRGEKLVVFPKPPTLAATIDALADAKMIVGPHGGAMYNSLLVPKHTAIIEFAPLKQTYHTICRSATVLGHWYWMFPWPGVAHSTPRAPINVSLLRSFFKLALAHLDDVHDPALASADAAAEEATARRLDERVMDHPL